MIGNLISALGIAVLSASIVIAGDVQAKVVLDSYHEVMVADTTSRIVGMENQKVYVANLSSIFYTMTSMSNIPLEWGACDYYDFDNVYHFDNTFDGQFETLKQNMVSNGYAVGCGMTGQYIVRNLPNNTSDNLFEIHFKVATRNEMFVWDNKFYLIDAFEFSPYVKSIGTLQDVYLDSSKVQFSVGVSGALDSSLYYGMTANNFIGGVATQVNVYYYDLAITIRQNDLPADVSSVNFGISGSWLCNFTGNNTFGLGYDKGYSAGYTSGFQAGRDYMANGTFTNLFNSIADTPLRFLYGIFNFDLFGVSVLVIVLSLLTGIVVFGIVKHFWK